MTFSTSVGLPLLIMVGSIVYWLEHMVHTSNQVSHKGYWLLETNCMLFSCAVKDTVAEYTVVTRLSAPALIASNTTVPRRLYKTGAYSRSRFQCLRNIWRPLYPRRLFKTGALSKPGALSRRYGMLTHVFLCLQTSCLIQNYPLL